MSLIAILDVIAMARASRRRVDVSYLAAEMGWPRTTALRRLQRYAGSGYLTLTRGTACREPDESWRAL